eukprot:3938370-Rhodomonas_salina.3
MCIRDSPPSLPPSLSVTLRLSCPSLLSALCSELSALSPPVSAIQSRLQRRISLDGRAHKLDRRLHAVPTVNGRREILLDPRAERRLKLHALSLGQLLALLLDFLLNGPPVVLVVEHVGDKHEPALTVRWLADLELLVHSHAQQPDPSLLEDHVKRERRVGPVAVEEEQREEDRERVEDRLRPELGIVPEPLVPEHAEPRHLLRRAREFLLRRFVNALAQRRGRELELARVHALERVLEQLRRREDAWHRVRLQRADERAHRLELQALVPLVPDEIVLAVPREHAAGHEPHALCAARRQADLLVRGPHEAGRRADDDVDV